MLTKIYQKLFFVLAILATSFATGHFGLVFLYNKIIEIPGPYRWACYLNCEKCLPSYFSGVLLLTTSFTLVVLFVAFKELTRSFKFWSLLSAIVFFYLACDETLMIHERVIPFAKAHFKLNGTWAVISWTVPAVSFLVLYIVASIKTLLVLPTKIQGLFINGGALYVTGAVGYEIVGLFINASRTSGDQFKLLGMGFEESLEMIGVLTFLYGLIFLLDPTQRRSISTVLDLSELKVKLFRAVLKGIGVSGVAFLPGILTVIGAHFMN